MATPPRSSAPLVLALALAACGNATPPSRDPVADASSSPAVSAPPVAASAAPPPSASATAEAPAPDAGAAQPAPTAEPAPAPVVADNNVAPTEGAELQARAKGLFDAIVKDDPDLAEAFWFPREPFIPLKDIKDPGKYWDQLHRTYRGDVHALHAKRKSWERAEFVTFDGWSRSKWVKPGDEVNKIGYHRAFHGKIHFKAGGEDGEIEVHTIITWQGKWYVTHLRKFKK
jgi:hypothetical protein